MIINQLVGVLIQNIIIAVDVLLSSLNHTDKSLGWENFDSMHFICV